LNFVISCELIEGKEKRRDETKHLIF